MISGSDDVSVRVGTIESPDTVTLVQASSTNAAYVRTPAGDYLLFTRQDTLLAQAFDLDALTVTGEPIPVTEEMVAVAAGAAYSPFSGATGGIIAYRPNGAVARRQLVWVDRAGKAVGSVGTPALYEHLELSPDGRRVAVDSRDPESQKLNLWLMDIATGTPTRFTFDPGEYDVPRWSPDGSRLTFPRLGDRKGIYEKLSNGVGGENQLLASPHDGLVIPDDWSPDGRFIVFMNLPPEARGNLWLLPLFGDRQAVQVPNTGQRSANGRFSPDGRWLAYESLEPASERLQVYVQPFPASGAKWQISGEGGMKPRWRRDGKELYFVAPDGALMAAPIMTEENFHVGVPVPLVTLRYAGRLIAQYPYDVSADGQRILIIAPEAEAGITPVTVLLNWIGLPAK